jgi:NAD(P)-dependent dehydrogenase (short-subunit alcohol dehydrogenase family)
MTVAVVTGANQGIGFALVAGLASRLGPDDLVLLTGRHPQRVADATEAVRREAQCHVEGRVVDVSDASAVDRFAAELGVVDIVVSNASAALTPERSQASQADTFVSVANGGTHAVLRSFGPRLEPGGRLIVVASSLGTLGRLDRRLWPLFDGVSLSAVENVVAGWLAAIHDGTASALGWPEWINVPSKVAQVAAVRAAAATRKDADLASGTLIAAVCPGLVDTPLSRPWFSDFSQAQTPAQAAEPILDLVFAPVDPAKYGELVRFGEILPWHSGKPVEVTL